MNIVSTREQNQKYCRRTKTMNIFICKHRRTEPRTRSAKSRLRITKSTLRNTKPIIISTESMAENLKLIMINSKINFGHRPQCFDRRSAKHSFFSKQRFAALFVCYAAKKCQKSHSYQSFRARSVRYVDYHRHKDLFDAANNAKSLDLESKVCQV